MTYRTNVPDLQKRNRNNSFRHCKTVDQTIRWVAKNIWPNVMATTCFYDNTSLDYARKQVGLFHLHLSRAVFSKSQVDNKDWRVGFLPIYERCQSGVLHVHASVRVPSFYLGDFGRDVEIFKEKYAKHWSKLNGCSNPRSHDLSGREWFKFDPDPRETVHFTLYALKNIMVNNAGGIDMESVDWENMGIPPAEELKKCPFVATMGPRLFLEKNSRRRRF